LVRDEGSWLDIGMSISHFCVCNLLILFIIALEQLSEVHSLSCGRRDANLLDHN